MLEKPIRHLALLFVLLFASSFAYAGDEGWIVDYDAAQKIAAKENKDILMDFTGSDWCGFCIKLDKNVFSKDEFKNKIPKQFVLLKLDYPKDKSKQTKKEIEQNKKLNKKYSISGYPTILLADAKGRPFAQTSGYNGDPAEKYVDDLLEMKKSKTKRDQLLTKAAAAQGAEKAKLLDEAVSLFDNELALAHYRDEIDGIIDADKNNAAGLKQKYEALIQAQDVKKKITAIMTANRGDKTTALEAINKLYDELKPTGAVAVEILFSRSYIKFQNKDMEGARADLEACVKLDPDSPRGKEIQGIIKRVFDKPKENAGQE